MFNISPNLVEAIKGIIDSSSAEANRLGAIANNQSKLAMSKGTRTRHRAAMNACLDAANMHEQAEKDNKGSNVENHHRVEKERFNRLSSIHSDQSIK